MAAFKYRPLNNIKSEFEKVGDTELGQFGKAYEFEVKLSPALKAHYININKALTAITEKDFPVSDPNLVDTKLLKSRLATAALLKVKNDSDETVKKSLLAANIDKILGIREDNKLDLRKKDLDALNEALDKIVTPGPKSKFTFLSLEQLGKNTETLLEEVDIKHTEKKKKMGEVRQGQVDLIKSTFKRLSIMTLKTNKDKLLNEVKDRLNELTQQIEDADKKIQESNKKLSELTDSKVITQKNVYSEQEALKQKLEIEKAALDKFNNEISRWKLLLEEQRMRMLSDEQRAKIFTGTWLYVKKLIKKQYEQENYGVWKLAGWKPEDSIVFQQIDKAIGVTAENKLDAQAEKEALTAFNQYINMIEEEKKFDLNKVFKKVEVSTFAKKDIQVQREREKEMEAELVQRKKELEKETKKASSQPPMAKADDTHPPKRLVEANLYSPGINLEAPKKLVEAVKSDKYPNVKNKEEKEKVKNELEKELASYPPQVKKELENYPHYERDLSGRTITLLSAMPKNEELKLKYGNTYLFIDNEKEKVAKLLYVKHLYEYKTKKEKIVVEEANIKNVEAFKNELKKQMGEETQAYFNREQIRTLITRNGGFSHSKSASSYIDTQTLVKIIKKATKTEAQAQDKTTENEKAVVMNSGYLAMRKFLKPLKKDPEYDAEKEQYKVQYGTVRKPTAEESAKYKKMTPTKEYKGVSDKEPVYEDYVKTLDPDFNRQVKEMDNKELQKDPKDPTYDPDYIIKSKDKTYMENHNPTSRLAPPTSFLPKKDEKKPETKDSAARKKVLERTNPSSVPSITLFRENMMKKDSSFAKPDKLKPVAPWVYVEDQKLRDEAEKLRDAMKKNKKNYVEDDKLKEVTMKKSIEDEKLRKTMMGKFIEEARKKKQPFMDETPNISDRPSFKR